MRQTLSFRNMVPREGAALLRYRAMLLFTKQEVYVLPHTRRWPGGPAAARKAIQSRKTGPHAIVKLL